MTLSDIIGGNIADGVAKIISLFKLDPNVAAQNAEKLTEIQADIVKKSMDAATAEVQAARDTIVADAQSGDKFTRRARPSFIYLVEAVLAYNYIVAPLIHRQPFVLPDPIIWLFGSAVLGYTGARSWEKFMGLPGDSFMNLFGIKAGNSSPKVNQ